MKHKYKLGNLDCANCAAALEQELLKIDGIDSASIDFINLSLTVEHKADEKQIFESLKKRAYDFENVRVYEEAAKKHTSNGWLSGEQIFEACKIAAALILLILSLVLRVSTLAKNIMVIAGYAIVGYPVLFKSVKNISKGRVFDENFLMAVASIGAIIIGRYFEALEVMIFYQTGELFSELAVNKSRNSISKLVDLKADFARLCDASGERQVEPQSVMIGDIISVRPGERVPLDGVVLEGNTAFDTSPLTGESMPRAASAGDEVLSGSINLSGVVKLRVTKNYSDSAVQKILELIENSSSSKANQEKFITKFARYYTPIVCALAVLLAVIPPLFDSLNFARWVYRALVFLVVSCPCALVISVPLSYFSGIGTAAKRGILVKGGNFLEALAGADTAVFDKTGTLTDGEFNVKSALAADGYGDFTLYASAAESASNHPLARAIVKAFDTQFKPKDITELAGLGVKAEVNGRAVICGSKRLLNGEGIEFDEPDITGAKIYTAIDGAYAGCIVIEDNVKNGASDMLLQLKRLGIKKTVMLTGDNKTSAEVISKKLNIDEYHSELMPEGKSDRVKELQKSGNVFFVGDGINDAPVLTQADIGISMGGVGSDAAIEASDIVIMNDNLERIPDAVRIAKKTRRIVKQNIAASLGVKGVILILSAIGLVGMQWAVFADVGVMVLAVLNAMRNFLKLK